MKAAIYRRVSTDSQNVATEFIGFASSVITRTEIPRLCFRTGSAISPPSLREAKGDEAILVEGIEIATHLSGARNDNPTNQPATTTKLIRQV